MNTRFNNKGFTLIELVVVIVILGILAKVAIPKFLNLSQDAKIASLHGLEATVKSAVNLVYSKSVIRHSEKFFIYAGNTLDSYVSTCPSDEVNGNVVCTTYGMPMAARNGILLALQNDISYKIMSSAGECDSSWNWCYYNLNGSPSGISGSGTIYLAPSNSVGYTGMVADSCVLRYTVQNNVDGTSSVTTKIFSDGCQVLAEIANFIKYKFGKFFRYVASLQKKISKSLCQQVDFGKVKCCWYFYTPKALCFSRCYYYKLSQFIFSE